MSPFHLSLIYEIHSVISKLILMWNNVVAIFTTKIMNLSPSAKADTYSAFHEFPQFQPL